MSRESAELMARLRAGDTPGVVAFFAGASEAERKPFAAAVTEWQTLLKLNEHALYSVRPEDKLEPAQRIANVPEVRPAADAAMLACASRAQLEAMSFTWSPPDEVFATVLRDRRPPWLGEFVSALIGARLNRGYGVIWRKVRRLVRAGLCPPPTHDHYVLGAIEGIQPVHDFAEAQRRIAQGLPPQPPTPLIELLLAERDWLETAFWRLFEIDGTGEVSPANVAKYGSDWTEPLVELARRGAVSRARLLDASLAALGRDFPQFRASWFSRLHEALAPTPAERAARVPQYLALLGSAVPPTVAFALEAIAIVDEAAPLPVRELIGPLQPALTARGKAIVKTALRLLERIAQREPAARAAVVAAATTALLHEAPDVQKDALALLDRHGDKTDATLRTRIAAVAPAIAASLRARLQSWSAETPAAAAPPSLAPAVSAVAAVFSAVPAGAKPPLSRLDPARAIAPIATVDELLEVAARVLEDLTDPNEIERVLDGVSRLCAEGPPDFARRAGPLRKRAERVFHRPPVWHTTSPFVVQAFAYVLLAWCDGEEALRDLELPGEEIDGPIAFLRARLLALAQRVAVRQAAPLLSAPTHRDGWIDATALVQRWHEWQNAKREPPLHEQVLALLRLAPEQRDRALPAAAEIRGEAGAALRLALGRRERTGRTAALWLAAWRSRQPFGDLEEFARAHPRLGLDAGTAARFAWHAGNARHTHEGRAWTRLTLELKRTPAVPKKTDSALLPVMLHQNGRSARILWQWSASLWPANREGLFSSGLERLATAVDWSDVVDRETAGLFGVLAQPHAEPRAMGCLVLALGLAAQEAALRAHATEDLIGLITEGRLRAPELGETMARLLDSGSAKFSRWAKSLAQVARVSPAHATAVADLLQRALHGDPAKAAAPGPLLELLVEVLAETGATLHDARTRAYLTALGTGGKTGRLAQQLLGP